MKPDVSVVIPLYNKEKYIRRSIGSVLRQTAGNFEIIIVDSSDDGSTDIVDQIGDPRIIHIIRDRTRAARARNIGVQIAKSDLIAFLDADDEWLPDHLEALQKIRKKFPDAGLYLTSYVKLTDTLEAFPMLFIGIPPPPWEGYLPHYIRICSRGDEPASSSSAAVTKEVFESVGGFREDLEYGEDQFLWGKISLSFPVAYSWCGLALYHTEAEGRLCNEMHRISEHPFATYLRQRLENNTIPPEIRKDCQSYIRRKRYSVIWGAFLMGSTENNSGTLSGTAGNSLRKKIRGMISRGYHSSVQTTGRRILGRVYGCHMQGYGSSKNKK